MILASFYGLICTYMVNAQHTRALNWKMLENDTEKL